jgi:hypothetical protein
MQILDELDALERQHIGDEHDLERLLGMLIDEDNCSGSDIEGSHTFKLSASLINI